MVNEYSAIATYTNRVQHIQGITTEPRSGDTVYCANSLHGMASVLCQNSFSPFTYAPPVEASPTPTWWEMTGMVALWMRLLAVPCLPSAVCCHGHRSHCHVDMLYSCLLWSIATVHVHMHHSGVNSIHTYSHANGRRKSSALVLKLPHFSLETELIDFIISDLW